MIFQAGLVFPLFYTLFRNREAASPRFIYLFYYVKNGIHTADMAVRAVESAVTLVDVSCLEDTGKVFVRYTDAGISLPVFEQYVVFRLVLFDQLILYQQCIFLCIDDGIGYVVNL